jgi:NSS family neurotransmitter:Na+ symporter
VLCRQVFFSLSLSEGIMITYSSYNPPTFPVISNVLTVALCNSGTELFAGACVFSILGG